MTALVPSRAQTEKLAHLAAKAQAGQWSVADDIDWRRAPHLPLWMSRDQARAMISQLYRGEIATSRLCQTLLREVAPGPARRCLAYQIADERRHAEAFRRYLEPLGGVAPVDPDLAWALDAAGRGSAGTLGAMVAFHVVVEGEVLRVQGSLARLLPCPLLNDINRRVARDEARHVAFGRIVLGEAVAALSAEARAQLYDWVFDLWQQTGARSLDGRADNGMAHSLLRGWLAGGWRHHAAALAQIGLVPAAEQGRAA